MVGRTEQLRVKALLTEAITVLCKNGLRYRNQFSVEGLLGITLDNDDVFLVNINETIGEAVKKAPTPPAKSPPPKKSCAQDSPKIRSEPFSPRRHRKRSNSSCESSPNVKKWRVESDSADEDSKPQVITIKEESVSEDESLQADFAAHVASMQGAITVTPFPNMSGDTDVNSSQSDSLLHDSSQSDSMLPMECFPQQDTFPPVGTLSQTLSIPGALNASSLSASLSVAGCSNWKGAAVPIPQITSDASQGQVLGLDDEEQRVVASNILDVEGCFVVTRVVRRRHQRYSSRQIRGVMLNMMRSPSDPLYVGQLKYLPKKVQVFYKCPPGDITDAALKYYNLTREQYSTKYVQSARPAKSGPFDWISYYSMVSGFAPHPLPPLSDEDLAATPPKRTAERRTMPVISNAMFNLMNQSAMLGMSGTPGVLRGAMFPPVMPDVARTGQTDMPGDQSHADWEPIKQEVTKWKHEDT